MKSHEKLAGLIFILVFIAFLFAPFSKAHAGTTVTSTGIMKHVVVEEIDGGHITYSYHADNNGKLKLMDTVVMYHNETMTVQGYTAKKNQERIDAQRAKQAVEEAKIAIIRAERARKRAIERAVKKALKAKEDEFNANLRKRMKNYPCTP